MTEKNPRKLQLLLRSLAIAGSLTGFKIGVFLVTNSIAILASAADSFMDFLVSLANFIFVREAARPADHNHPYGHGKIETLAGLLQSLFIGGVAVGIAWMSVKRFAHPQDIQQPVAGMIVTAVGLLLNFWHTRNLRASMISSSSHVMATEYLHYASDTFVYFGVLVSFVLYTFTGSLFWDPLISLCIVIYLLKNVVVIFHSTLTELLDMQLPDATLKEIDTAIHAFSPKVVDYHDLRTRKVGPTKFIEFHVVFRDVETFREAHSLTEGLMDTLREKYPGAIVTVHADPEDGI